jgi:hypothetical protein
MATQPKDGVTESSLTEGAQPYALGGAVAPWRGFVSSDNGKSFYYGAYQGADEEGIGGGFEVGEGTYDHNARTLSRTTIIANHQGTTLPVEWGAGVKEISLVMPGARAVMTGVENKFEADQYFEGYRLILDTDRDSWIDCETDDFFRLFLGGTETVGILSSAGGRWQLTGADDSAALGPAMILQRQSASAAVNDIGPQFEHRMQNASQANITTFLMRSILTTATAGSHAARHEFWIPKAGTLQRMLYIQPDVCAVPSGTFFTGSKTTSNLNVTGCELEAIGVGRFVASTTAPVIASRLTDNGAMMGFFRGTTAVGTINWSGSVLAFQGGVLCHLSEWGEGPGGEEYEQQGWVVCSTDTVLNDGSGRHPEVVLSTTAGDPTVYGVIMGERQATLDGGSPRLQIEGSGTGLIRVVGPVENGDLLETSDILGTARRQADNIHRSSTVAKARGASVPDEEIRIIPCTLMGG